MMLDWYESSTHTALSCQFELLDPRKFETCPVLMWNGIKSPVFRQVVVLDGSDARLSCPDCRLFLEMVKWAQSCAHQAYLRLVRITNDSLIPGELWSWQSFFRRLSPLSCDWLYTLETIDVSKRSEFTGCGLDVQSLFERTGEVRSDYYGGR